MLLMHKLKHLQSASHEVKQATIIFVLLRLVCCIVIRIVQSIVCEWIFVRIELAEIIWRELLWVVVLWYAWVRIVIDATRKVAEDIVSRVNTWVTEFESTIIIIWFRGGVWRFHWVAAVAEGIAKISKRITIVFLLFGGICCLRLCLHHLSKWIGKRGAFSLWWRCLRILCRLAALVLYVYLSEQVINFRWLRLFWIGNLLLLLLLLRLRFRLEVAVHETKWLVILCRCYLCWCCLWCLRHSHWLWLLLGQAGRWLRLIRRWHLGHV